LGFNFPGARERLGEEISRMVVLITASGLQGEQPLVEQNNVGKGILPNRFVTLGKELALKLERGVPLPPQHAGEKARTRRTADASSLSPRLY